MQTLLEYIVNNHIQKAYSDELEIFCNVIEVLKGCETTENFRLVFLKPTSSDDKNTFEYKSFLQPLNSIFDFTAWNTCMSYMVNDRLDSYAIFINHIVDEATHPLMMIRYHFNAKQEDSLRPFKKFIDDVQGDENDEYITIDIASTTPEVEKRFNTIFDGFAKNINFTNNCNVYLINYTKLKETIK